VSLALERDENIAEELEKGGAKKLKRKTKSQSE